MAEYRAYLPCGLVLKATGRAGIGWYDDEFTQDVFSRFLGYADLGAGYRSNDGRWELSVDVTPVFAPFNVNVNAATGRPLVCESEFSTDTCSKIALRIGNSIGNGRTRRSTHRFGT